MSRPVPCTLWTTNKWYPEDIASKAYTISTILRKHPGDIADLLMAERMHIKLTKKYNEAVDKLAKKDSPMNRALVDTWKRMLRQNLFELRKYR